jgi:hypothetical protein
MPSKGRQFGSLLNIRPDHPLRISNVTLTVFFVEDRFSEAVSVNFWPSLLRFAEVPKAPGGKRDFYSDRG